MTFRSDAAELLSRLDRENKQRFTDAEVVAELLAAGFDVLTRKLKKDSPEDAARFMALSRAYHLGIDATRVRF